MKIRQRSWFHPILSGLAVFSLVAVVGCGSDGTSGTTSEPPSETDPEPPTEPDPEPEPPIEPEPPVEPPPAECGDSFDSTYEAIQAVIFEGQGCASDVCHGSAASGGLDLRADVSHANLIGAPSVGSALLRVSAGSVQESYLFQKIAAKTAPELQTSPITGSPMPVGGTTVTHEQLEALRIWIESSAPEFGVLGDEFGGNRIADLLGTCLPPPTPIRIEPLEPPPADEGLQFEMPPHAIKAFSETELCFATYHDFRDQIPERFMSDDREIFYTWRDLRKEDPNTHHNIVGHSGFYADAVDDPSFGRWHCVQGATPDADCDPRDLDACGEGGFCVSEIKEATACFGFGPDGSTFRRGRIPRTGGTPGIYNEEKTHGIFYWNSHAFNLSAEDLEHHLWLNLYFTDDLEFQVAGIGGAGHIFAPDAAPFTKEEYCREHVFAEGARLITLSSHTHKRGERFTIDLKNTGERLYDNPFWEDPLVTVFDPPMVFDSTDPDERTVIYCGLYNNGVRPDGTPDPDLVTRNSRRPRGGTCPPTACAEGRIAEPCSGPDDHATCDTSPGAGDGLCDACAISGGTTSDDEMFIVSGSQLIANE